MIAGCVFWVWGLNFSPTNLTDLHGFGENWSGLGVEWIQEM
jgi:hypothetical protein